MSRPIRIAVASGKGGTGKTTIATNLAVCLAETGICVAYVDCDVEEPNGHIFLKPAIHGPSIPRLLHLEGTSLAGGDKTILPARIDFNPGMLKVMSIGFLLRYRDDAVIWRGPMKSGVIKQFLKDVEWGDLDYLVVDSPPGTWDEPLSIAQLIENADGAIVVTMPQQVAVQDVRRCMVLCRQLDLPVNGVVENMSGFTCPKCGESVKIFGTDGGRAMAEEMDVPYLGAIPIEPEVVVSGDSGTPVVQAMPHSETARAFGRIVRTLLGTELLSPEAPASPRRAADA